MATYPIVGECVLHFRIVRKLGEGGMGAVFEAVDEKLGRHVALKLLPPSLAANPERRARFLREARLAAAAQHRSIATVHEIGEDGDRVFIAMEYVRGESLRQRLERGPLPVKHALTIGAEIARALARAHALGVVHRDLKPDNVMLDRDGEVKLLDFGIAKSLAAEPEVIAEHATALPATQLGRVIGTPGYMSPEQARGEAVDARSDLFSLGAVLYELLTGERAFPGKTAPALLVAALEHEPPALSSRVGGIPRGLELLLERCLAKDSARRIASADELARELDSLVGGLDQLETAKTVLPASEQVSRADTLPTPFSIRADGSKRRKVPRWAWTGGALALLVAGSLATAWVSSGWRANPPPSDRAAGPIGADAAIACPILEQTGQGLPPGWVGAAAATLLCVDLSLALGAEDARTRVPAELLELPTQPLDAFPMDPFGSADARERSLSAAKTSPRWLDGRVEATGSGFRLSLALHTPSGQQGNAIESSGSTLHEAVFSAVDAWIRAGHVQPRMLGADVHRVWGCTTLDCARKLVFGELIAGSSEDRKQSCDLLGRDGGHAQWMLSSSCGAPATPPPGASHEPVRLALEAASRLSSRSALESAALAEQLDKARESEASPRAFGLLLETEARLRLASGQPTEAQSLAELAASRAPRSCSAREIQMSASAGRPNRARVGAAFAAWCPWRARAYAEYEWEPGEILPFARLAVALEPSPDFAAWLGLRLLSSGQREEARILAGRFASGSVERRRLGSYILALVEADEGKLDAAAERLRASIWRNSEYPADEVIELTLQSAVLISEVIGKDSELGGAFVRDYLLPDPPRVERGTPYLVVAHAASRAPRSLALGGLARVRQLLAQGVLRGTGTGDDAYLTGCERMARGDPRGAVKHWRSLAGVALFQFSLRPEAFDSAGETELASRIDSYQIQRPWRMGLAFVREASRAERRGDRTRARELATKVVDKWSTADAELPHVGRMRALLARLGAKG